MHFMRACVLLNCMWQMEMRSFSRELLDQLNFQGEIKRKKGKKGPVIYSEQGFVNY